MTTELVHYKHNDSPERFTACHMEAEIGVRFTDHTPAITCTECLKQLLYKSNSAYRPTNTRFDCGDCVHLSITEEEQAQEYVMFKSKSPHMCNKFSMQVFHPSRRNKLIERGKRCMLCNGYEPK